MRKIYAILYENVTVIKVAFTLITQIELA